MFLHAGLDDDGAETESSWRILSQVRVLAHSRHANVLRAQVLLPFLVAGAGMVAAGLVLDIVQHWEVFQKVSEIFILVPALLGLKGNLEMTLASRLSTLVCYCRVHCSVHVYRQTWATWTRLLRATV